MAKLSHIAATAVLGAALTACAAGGIIVQPPTIGSYDPEMLGYAASRGALLTQVVGNPFGVPQQEIEAAVASSMTGATFGRHVTFAAKVSPDYASPYRVVFLLGPAPGAQASRLCDDPDQPTAVPVDRLRALAAFCSTDTVITSIAGSAPKTAVPNDPAFRELIRRMTMDLFPIRDPDEDDAEGEIRIP